MPGYILEDNVVVSAKSFVPKNSKLKKKDSVYAGIPVKKIR